VSWMVLSLLGQDCDNIRVYSWGSAVLAWLYRQLCDACKRSGQDANLGGCAYLLQIWIWERLLVGRPHRGPVEVHTNVLFFIHADLYSLIIHLSNFGTILQVWSRQDFRPTFRFVWKTATAVRGPPGRRYKFYTNELDCLTHAQAKTHVH
jgi:hypothetical protein